MKFILTLLAIAATFRSVTAQDGSLDLSFNTDGMLTTSIGTEDYGRAVAVQPDGKILVAGYSYDGDRDQCAVVRYLADGSLDNSFDFDGIALTSIGDSGNRGHALAIQNDGKIVVAGYAYN
ncbi:MAG: hypothetical protein JNM00_10995, partial [Flavobacteriales bacterium]|nr:hypothetical protein [Flavobacteriales bacterium]